jgi:glycosyltransferase involved in cell wall biosynthesis
LPDKHTTTSLRIAHVITRLINGGADENTVIACNHAVAANHEVFLVHGKDTRPEILAKVDKRVELIKVPALIRPLAPPHDLRAFIHLLKIFRNLKPDIVHTHTSKAGILGRLAAWRASVPGIVHGVHIAPFVNVGILQRSIYKVVEKTVAPITDAYISVSRGMRDAYLEAEIGDPQKHHVIASGFDLDVFRNAGYPEDWRDLLCLAPDASRPPVLLMMAAFEPRKRHLEFLRCFPPVVTRFPELRLLLAGEGKLGEKIKAELDRLNLQQNVILTGFRNDPESLIALADLCLIVSTREGLPRVIMQYLAGGKPCIASELPGLEEVLLHGENGLVIQAEDMEGFIAAIMTLLSNHEERNRLTRGAQMSNLSEWDQSRLGERTESVYCRILTEKGRLNTPNEVVNL